MDIKQKLDAIQAAIKAAEKKPNLTEADKDHFARQLRDIAIEDEDGDYLGRIMALRSDAAALYVKPTRNTNID